MSSYRLLILLTFSLTVLRFTSVFCEKELNFDFIVNNNVVRTVTIANSFNIQDTKVNFENIGNNLEKEYYLIVDSDLNEKLCLFLVIQDSKEIEPTLLPEPIFSEGHSYFVYSVPLSSPLKPGESRELNIMQVYARLLKPSPDQISQSSYQGVILNDSHIWPSPYVSKIQKTSFKFPGDTIQITPKFGTQNHKKNIIVSGPYNDVAKFAIAPTSFYFKFNSPLFYAPVLKRTVYISHWGSLTIKDHVLIENYGAKIKGDFISDLQDTKALHNLVVKLPKDATGVYYKDDLGNISTSMFNGNELNLIPRFSIYGGWKTSFKLGYRLNLHNYITFNRSKSNLYTLEIPLGPHYLDDFSIGEVIFQVVLPEGAKFVSANFPFVVKRESGTRFSFLDLVGSQVVIIKKVGASKFHLGKNIQITYKFNSVNLLRKPGLLSLEIFILIIAKVLFDYIFVPIVDQSKPKLMSDEGRNIKLSKYLEFFKIRLKCLEELDHGSNNIKNQTFNNLKKNYIDNSNSCVSLFREIKKIDGKAASIIERLESHLPDEFIQNPHMNFFENLNRTVVPLLEELNGIIKK